MASAAAMAQINALEMELETAKEAHQSAVDGLKSELEATQQVAQLMIP